MTTPDEAQAHLPVTPELLPCPFCGDVAYLDAAEFDDPSLEPEDREVVAWSVGCSCCAFHGPHLTEGTAAAAWNTRISHSLPGDGLRAENIKNALLDMTCANMAPIEWDDADWHQVRRALAALTPSALSGDAGEGRENVLFNLTWIAPPSPELPDGRRVHPEPMTGRQSFPSWEAVMKFMSKRCAGTEFVALTQTTSRTVDRSAEFRAALPSHQGAE